MKQYVVDAFADKLFQGNQAAICVVPEFPDPELMTKIAQENRFSETAFVVQDSDCYKLRWFTPGGEIDLCGHATLAAGYVLLRFYETSAKTISFSTMSGKLTVERAADLVGMNFPAYTLKPVPVIDIMTQATGTKPEAAFMGRDLLLIYPDEAIIRTMKPDMNLVNQLDGLLLHVTARGHDGIDCVSRSFAPKLGIVEDPVCGSGHCHIAPYWSKVLGKDTLTAYQASERGGILQCEVEGERVKLSGQAKLFSVGEIMPDD